MRTVGVISTVAGAAAVAGAGLLLIGSLPDIKRYLKIRSM